MTLQKLSDDGATLNKEKCIVSTNQLTFHGHVFGEKGTAPDPAKVQAIVNIKLPQSVPEIRSFVEMAQYVAWFIPHHATIIEPPCQLTKKEAK